MHGGSDRSVQPVSAAPSEQFAGVCKRVCVQQCLKPHQGAQAESDGGNVSRDNDKTGQLVTIRGS